MTIISSFRRLLGRQLNRLLWHVKHSRLPRSPEGRLMLHVGCGDINAPGYINIDARAKPHVHFTLGDLRDLSFVPKQSVDLVYMCHVLEHVRHPEVASVLRAAQSILKPGGTLRLAVPDFDLLLKVYEAHDRDVLSILAPLMGGQDYPQNAHFIAFTKSSLSALMQRCGFVNVRSWSADKVDEHRFVDTSNSPYLYGGNAYPISLNLEGNRA